jgi:hypothetical protein
MKRHYVFIPLLTLALVGFAKGQSTGENEASAKNEATQKDVRPTSMPVTLVIAPNEGMSEKDKAAEQAALEVESEFIHSFNGNRKLMDSILAPGFINLSERWGTGYWQDKTQTLDLRTGPQEREVNTSIDHRLTVQVFGNTVIMTGISYTVLSYNGKLSRVTRQFMFTYGKQDDGRWLILGKCIADIPNGLSAPAPAMMLLGPDGQPPPAPAGSTSIYHYDYRPVPDGTAPSK